MSSAQTFDEKDPKHHDHKSKLLANTYLLKMKFALVFIASIAGVSAWAPRPFTRPSSSLFSHLEKGAGGMFDTRNPDPVQHEDARKSISAAPSFEEYLKQRSGGGAAAPAPAAPAPAAYAPPPAAAPPAYAPPPAAAPAAYAPPPAAYAPPPAAAPAAGAGGTVVDTLSSLQGPGVVWGAEGVEVGHEESELKGYDNFGKFFAALQSTGVAAELSGAGPFTVFAPTDSAMETYEKIRGPIDANVVKMQIVPGKIASGDVRGNLDSLAGPLTYRYAVRKHFINDAIIGEKSFGPYPDFPIDVECSNGVIHAVGLCFAMY